MSLDATHATTVTALIATLCAAAAPLMQPVASPRRPLAGMAGTAVTLTCRVVRNDDHGSRLALRRTDGLSLQAGVRIAWADTGTPAPVGEWRRLAAADAGGQAGEWLIDSPLRVRGAGCAAAAHLD